VRFGDKGRVRVGRLRFASHDRFRVDALAAGGLRVILIERQRDRSGYGRAHQTAARSSPHPFIAAVATPRTAAASTITSACGAMTRPETATQSLQSRLAPPDPSAVRFESGVERQGALGYESVD
jgi:hypothetical protein